VVESAGHASWLLWLHWVCFYIVGVLNLTSYAAFKYVCVLPGERDKVQLGGHFCG